MPKFTFGKRASSAAAIFASNEKEIDSDTASGIGALEDSASTAPLVTPAAPPPPVYLKVKRVDYYYSKWTRSWKYKNMGERVTPEKVPVAPSSSGNDPWLQFCFVVIRTLPTEQDEEPTFSIVVKSQYLLQACKDVIQEMPGLSWIVDPLHLDPHLLVTFLPAFDKYYHDLQNKSQRTDRETNIMKTVGVLTEYVRRDFKTTLATVANLTAHGEINFDVLYAILVPRSILITTDPITREPRAVRLISAGLSQSMCGPTYDLQCESIDTVDGYKTPTGDNLDVNAASPAKGASAFGKVHSRIPIYYFEGTIKIKTLSAYPLKYHPDSEGLRQRLLARGKKWASLLGVHHMQYEGTAAINPGGGCRIIRYNVNSRIMVDRGTFKRLQPNYAFPAVKEELETPLPAATSKKRRGPVPSSPSMSDPNLAAAQNTTAVVVRNQSSDPLAVLTEEDYILASPLVYGFSLADKIWLEFNVELVEEIKWNDEAFRNLVLPSGRKMLLQSLVEAHSADLGFDDFVQGKGHGLVINLYGPPGVGKTLSAEATSEHVRRPLYVVGSGDLGTEAGALDANLSRIFDIATGWKAIVLIDEADVFLEQRSLHDLERNAMVAVFLRHVEYYRGILFLTTNRVKTFDEAFLSRIHVALHFQELSADARVQVWRAFLEKMSAMDAMSDEQMRNLGQRPINGRQIKNAVRTACSLAVSRKEPLNYQHIVETLDAMHEFTMEFRAMNAKLEGSE